MSAPVSVLSTLEVGNPYVSGDLTMWPLLGGNGREPAYDLAAAAFGAGTLTVQEVSQGGSVPTLRVINGGPRPVLLLDGEQLVGAKQNRVLNVTVLVAAGTKLDVPVSCVEQGRWHYSRRDFVADDYIMNSELRARKMRDVSSTLRHRASRAGDQGAVWHGIAEKAMSMDVPSSTGAMRDTYQRHRTPIEGFVRDLAPVDRQVGAIFAAHGRFLGLEAFDAHATLDAMLPKLVRSHALEALDPRRRRPGDPDGDDLALFLEAVGGLAMERYPAVGLGHEYRLSGPGLQGGALEVDGTVLHVSVLVDGPTYGRFRSRTRQQPVGGGH
jgi:ARG and Rhodanese-Phosphatase-superfamily-associated Protein domain